MSVLVNACKLYYLMWLCCSLVAASTPFRLLFLRSLRVNCPNRKRIDMKKKKNIVLICQLIPCNLKDPLVLDLPDRSRCFPRACRFTFHLVSDQFSGRGLCASASLKRARGAEGGFVGRVGPGEKRTHDGRACETLNKRRGVRLDGSEATREMFDRSPIRSALRTRRYRAWQHCRS